MDQSSLDYVATSRAKDKRLEKDIRAKHASDGLAGLIWQQRLLISNCGAAGPGALKCELWAKLQFLSDPVCRRGGAPFEIAVDGMPKCAACLAGPPVFDRARAALVHGDATQDLALGLK